MRRVTVLAIAAGALLVAAGGANAGCWATVGIQPLPDQVAAGETWPVTVTVRQHGETPLAGATPQVIVTSVSGSLRTSSSASSTLTSAVATAVSGTSAARGWGWPW